MTVTVNVHHITSIEAGDFSDHGSNGFCTLDIKTAGAAFSFFFRTEDLVHVNAAAALLNTRPSVLKQKEEKPQ